MSSDRITPAIFAIIAGLGSLVALGSAPSAHEQHTLAAPAPTLKELVAQAVSEGNDELLAAVAKDDELIAAEAPDSQAVTEKREALEATMDELRALKLPHAALILTPITPVATLLGDVTEAKESALARLSEASSTYEAIVASEKARIEAEAAEARRLQAEEAARLAASAVKPVSPRGTAAVSPSSSTGSAPITEDPQTRLARIAALMGVRVTYGVGGCGQTWGGLAVLGCYTTGSGVFVSARGMERDDCGVQYIIAHEARHGVQVAQGLVEFNAAGEATNRDWLEKDADDAARAWGCR